MPMPTLTPNAPLVDDAARREFIALLGAAGLLTACTNGDDGASESAAQTRGINHLGGTTDVPVDPKRVIVLEPPLLPGLIALGLPPVATVGEVEQLLDPLADLLPAGCHHDGRRVRSTEPGEDRHARAGPHPRRRRQRRDLPRTRRHHRYGSGRTWHERRLAVPVPGGRRSRQPGRAGEEGRGRLRASHRRAARNGPRDHRRVRPP